MLKPLLKEILAEIENLEPTDRLLLDRELARRAEKQWKSESTKARKGARRRKIDQPLIDRLIERRRYGS